jgi:UDP-glucuronate decarboxylase
MADISAMDVLVTGGAGFIGSHLCERLIHCGHRVICVDNLVTGRVENLLSLMDHPRFELIKHDIIQPLAISGPLDRIYNLACPASPAHYQLDPIATTRTCVVGAYNVLEIAREKRAVILQASTSEIYGDPEIHPQPESYFGNVNTSGPRACYDEGKRCAETLYFDYHRRYRLPVKVARIFNTYGPRMLEDDGRVISNFIVQALKSQPITLYGDGRQTRSFCYIDDLIDGLQLLMESPPRMIGPCNLGNPHEVTIGEIANLVLGHVGSRSRIEYRPLPQDDPKRRRPVISLAQRSLHWHPRISLDDGLRTTIRYFSQKLFAPALENGRRYEQDLLERRRITNNPLRNGAKPAVSAVVG